MAALLILVFVFLATAFGIYATWMTIALVASVHIFFWVLRAHSTDTNNGYVSDWLERVCFGGLLFLGVSLVARFSDFVYQNWGSLGIRASGSFAESAVTYGAFSCILALCMDSGTHYRGRSSFSPPWRTLPTCRSVPSSRSVGGLMCSIPNSFRLMA